MPDTLNPSVSATDTNLIEELENEQLPLDPTEMWNFEHRLHIAFSQLADEVMRNKSVQMHQSKEIVDEAVLKARQNSPYPLINKGRRFVTILLMGGTKVVIETPYLRKNWKKVTGRKHKKRGKKGTGTYPVLAALGITDRVSPATREEVSLYTIQASSYQEALLILARKGIHICSSTLKRIAMATAQADITLRDAALASAMNIPVSQDGPLANKRVRINVDGGRTRTRKNTKGRKPKNGRRKFYTPWREPRVLVIDVLYQDGSYDSLRLPLYDVLIDDADATFYLIVGYLRLLGAAYAEIVEFVADGAEWIWDRVDLIITQAEIDESKFFKILDFYHAAEHLSEALEVCKGLKSKERKKIYRQLRHILRHNRAGIEKVIEELRQLGQKYKADVEMAKASEYFKKHINHMRYAIYEEKRLPIGSGQVESAVRRLINLRFKAPGSFWKEKVVENLMHLRACFKSGRWGEMMQRLLSGEYILPSFEVAK